MRFFLEIAYNGFAFHGWQIQKNARSVQETLEAALSLIFQQKISVVGCGRTDTKVHASSYFLHFDSPVIENREKFIFKLNSILPESISAHQVKSVSADAHARFDATARSYRYHVHKWKNPFLENQSLLYSKPLNIQAMNEAAQYLLGKQDFTSFCKLHSDTNNNLCDVTKAIWVENRDELIFEITANRFLRNMVRSIVGTLLEVGSEQLSLEAFKEVIAGKNRQLAGKSVAGYALYLNKIDYPYIESIQSEVKLD